VTDMATQDAADVSAAQEEALTSLHRPHAVRKLDSLGRLVLPQDMRRHIGLAEGALAKITITPSGLLVSRYEETCVICGQLPFDGVREVRRGQAVCRDCAWVAARAFGVHER